MYQDIHCISISLSNTHIYTHTHNQACTHTKHTQSVCHSVSVMNSVSTLKTEGADGRGVMSFHQSRPILFIVQHSCVKSKTDPNKKPAFDNTLTCRHMIWKSPHYQTTSSPKRIHQHIAYQGSWAWSRQANRQHRGSDKCMRPLSSISV